MATYYNHCQVGIVDASGNVNVIYPQTYASDVKVGTANSSIGITTSSTVQSLISKLGSAATKNVGDLVTNSASSTSTSQAYSCNQINSKLNELNSNYEFTTSPMTKNMQANTIVNLFRFTTVVGGVYLIVTNIQANGVLPPTARCDFYSTEGHLQGNLPSENSGGYPAESMAILYKATETSNTIYSWSSISYTLLGGYCAKIRLH